MAWEAPGSLHFAGAGTAHDIDRRTHLLEPAQQFGGYDLATLTRHAGSIDTPGTRQWRGRYVAAVTKDDEETGVVLEAARESLGSNTLSLG